MAVDKKALALANKYTEETIKGEGAIKGKDGDSAYQIAVKNGFSGTEAEWLESLKVNSIDDSKIAEDSTYSSKKVEEELAKKVDTEIVTGYVNLDTGADLNTLVDYGTYRTTTKRIDRIANVPVQVAGMLEVRLTGGVIYQTYKTIDDEMYIRSSEDTGATWADWKKVSTEEVVDLTDKITYTEYKKTVYDTQQLTMCGKIVCFNINMTSVSKPSSRFSHLATLPVEARPTLSKAINITTNSGKPCYVYINPNGAVAFQLNSTEYLTEEEGIRCCFTYII